MMELDNISTEDYNGKKKRCKFCGNDHVWGRKKLSSIREDLYKMGRNKPLHEGVPQIQSKSQQDPRRRWV